MLIWWVGMVALLLHQNCGHCTNLERSGSSPATFHLLVCRKQMVIECQQTTIYLRWNEFNFVFNSIATNDLIQVASQQCCAIVLVENEE